VRYHAAVHEVDQDRRDASLYDVTAKHDDDGAAFTVGLDYCVDHRKEVSRNENIGKCTKESRE
jgi:hypothetical protein